MNSRPATAARIMAAGKPARGRRRQPRDLRAAKDALVREHIMEVAEGVFAEQGFASTRMQDIARAAGISLGTLYQAYPGKSELYRAILIARDTQMLNVVMAKGQQVLQQPQSIEQLLWLMASQLGFLLEHPDYLRMQLQQGHAWYHSAAQPSPEEQQIWERGLQVMAQVFNWGVAQRLFIPGEAADQARLMLALQQTRLANWVNAGMQEPHSVVIARIQADFVRNFCVASTAITLHSDDGASLSAETRDRIDAISASM